MRVNEIDLSVVITCYNEQDYILDTINSIRGALDEFSYRYEMIVIDDHSRDGSVAKINDFIKKNPNIPLKLVANSKNRGFANNFIDGAFLGSGKYYRLCCGDNSEPKESLKRIFSCVGKADIIIPVQNQNRLVGRSLSRKLLSKTFVLLANMASGFNIEYYNGMPIFLRQMVLRHPPITAGFGFWMDAITRQLDEGVSYLQVKDLLAIEQKGGKSSALSMRNFLSVAHTFLEIIFRRIRRLIYGKHFPKSIEVFEESHARAN